MVLSDFSVGNFGLLWYFQILAFVPFGIIWYFQIFTLVLFYYFVVLSDFGIGTDIIWYFMVLSDFGILWYYWYFMPDFMTLSNFRIGTIWYFLVL